MTGEAEARIDREVRAKSIDGRTPYQVALARIAKAEQERDSARTFAYEMGKREGYAEGKAAAEARERDLREARSKAVEALDDLQNKDVPFRLLEPVYRALQATQEDVEA